MMKRFSILNAFGIKSLEPDKRFSEKLLARLLEIAEDKQSINFKSILFSFKKPLVALSAVLIVFISVLSIYQPKPATAKAISYLALANTYFHQFSEYSPTLEHDGIILLFDPRIVKAEDTERVTISYEYGSADTCPNYILTPDISLVDIAVNDDTTVSIKAWNENDEIQIDKVLNPNNNIPNLIKPSEISEESSYVFECSPGESKEIINSLVVRDGTLTRLEVSTNNGDLIYSANVVSY